MENPAVLLFLALGVLIMASRLAGSLARTLGQPRVLGELLVGVLLGPTVFNLIGGGLFGSPSDSAHLSDTIHEFAEIGVLLLMFLIGIEVNLDEIRRVGRVAIFAGVLGALVPIGMTLVTLQGAFNYAWQPALFGGVVLAATSVSISAQVLLELGVLKTKEGNALLATALIDDVLAILLVSITVAITVGNGVSEAAAGSSFDVGALIGIAARMGFYLVGAALAGWIVVPRIVDLFDRTPRLGQSFGVAAIGIALAFVFAWSAEALGGVAAITGAFIAGVGVSQANPRARHAIEEAASSLAYGLFVPIFFLDVGLGSDLRGFPLAALPEAAALLVVAIASKVIGCGLGARLGGFNNGEALRVGVCMISRGEVGLIILSLAVADGVIPVRDPLYGSLFLVILLTTLITPVGVRRVFRSQIALQAAQPGRV